MGVHLLTQKCVPKQYNVKHHQNLHLQICSVYSGWTRVWDNQQKNPYKYHGNQWVGYDDKDSIRIKAAWIKNNGFFGVMIWAINQDDMTGKCGQKQILLHQINYAISN